MMLDGWVVTHRNKQEIYSLNRFNHAGQKVDDLGSHFAVNRC